MNLLHDIPITDDGFKTISCIVEIPKDTNTKYEYNENLEVFELTRCLVSSLKYPINYGFITQTIALDNDPLDVLIFNHDPIDRGSLVKCRPLGILEFEDEGEIDNKLLAVPHWSPIDRYSKLSDIEGSHLKIYKHFFRIYKLDRSASTKVGEWQNGSEAFETIRQSHERWKTSPQILDTLKG